MGPQSLQVIFDRLGTISIAPEHCSTVRAVTRRPGSRGNDLVGMAMA